MWMGEMGPVIPQITPAPYTSPPPHPEPPPGIPPHPEPPTGHPSNPLSTPCPNSPPPHSEPPYRSPAPPTGHRAPPQVPTEPPCSALQDTGPHFTPSPRFHTRHPMCRRCRCCRCMVRVAYVHRARIQIRLLCIPPCSTHRVGMCRFAPLF